MEATTLVQLALLVVAWAWKITPSDAQSPLGAVDCSVEDTTPLDPYRCLAPSEDNPRCKVKPPKKKKAGRTPLMVTTRKQHNTLTGRVISEGDMVFPSGPMEYHNGQWYCPITEGGIIDRSAIRFSTHADFQVNPQLVVITFAADKKYNAKDGEHASRKESICQGSEPKIRDESDHDNFSMKSRQVLRGSYKRRKSRRKHIENTSRVKRKRLQQVLAYAVWWRHTRSFPQPRREMQQPK